MAATGYIILDETFFDNIPDKLAAVDYFDFDVTKANGIDINRLKLTLPSWATCLLYTSPSPRDLSTSRMPSSA